MTLYLELLDAAKAVSGATVYDADFFLSVRQGADYSAAEIVPLILELLRPNSVIDIGCGDGTWLKEFVRGGVSDFLGVDGADVGRDILRIPENAFLRWDLTLPLRLGRTYDLVTSLEVAEHLPSESADTFVDSLTRLGQIVMFSAAVPGQGGESHVNERWPAYWEELFVARNFVLVDCLRKRVWDNPRVAWWYAQNLFLFV